MHRTIGVTAELEAGLPSEGLVEPLCELAVQIPASDNADMQNTAVQMGRISPSLRPAFEVLLFAVKIFRDLAGALAWCRWRGSSRRRGELDVLQSTGGGVDYAPCGGPESAPSQRCGLLSPSPSSRC